MDPQQQFCLKWNSFGSNLATAFGNLFKSESLADVTLFCEGKTYLILTVRIAMQKMFVLRMTWGSYPNAELSVLIPHRWIIHPNFRSSSYNQSSSGHSNNLLLSSFTFIFVKDLFSAFQFLLCLSERAS